MRHFRCAKLSVFCTLSLLAGVPSVGQDRGDSGGQGRRGADNQAAQRYSDNCAVCHGAEGKGTDRGAAIATLPGTIAKSDAALLAVLRNGTSGGMPAFPQFTDQEAQAMVRFLRRLQGQSEGTSAGANPTGDTDAGKIIYFGKGKCSSCHMINGQGGFIASDLTAFAQNRNITAVLQAIVKPDASLAPGSQVVDVETITGEKISGIARAEDNLELTLQSEDGRYHFLSRSSLAKVTYTGHSLMPHDYGTRLTAQELNDLVTYLVVTAKNAPPEPVAPRRRGGGRY